TLKRYEVHPDPDRLKRYGITLGQLQNAIANSNGNVGGDYLFQGDTVQNVRGIGLIGGGRDPMEHVLSMSDPRQAVVHLRDEEERRIQQIRQIVIASVNNVPVRVEDIVEGGPVRFSGELLDRQGVVVGHQTRLGKVSLSRPKRDADGREVLDEDGKVVWINEEEKIQGSVW